MGISETSVGIIIGQASEWGHGELTTLLMRSGVSEGDPGPVPGMSRSKRAGAALKLAFKKGNDRGLIACALKMLNAFRPADPDDDWVTELAASLRLDGYLLKHTGTESTAASWTPTGFVPAQAETRIWTIEPLGSDEIPLPPQVGSLQRELEEGGHAVAANHFSQAYRAFSSGDLEAANSQLRPTFENIVISIAERMTPWRGTSGGSAIEALRIAAAFEKGEHEYVIGLWRMSHKNGSHPGLSNEEEALFRLTSVTALIRFLLYRFP